MRWLHAASRLWVVLGESRTKTVFTESSIVLLDGKWMTEKSICIKIRERVWNTKYGNSQALMMILWCYFRKQLKAMHIRSSLKKSRRWKILVFSHLSNSNLKFCIVWSTHVIFLPPSFRALLSTWKCVWIQELHFLTNNLKQPIYILHRVFFVSFRFVFSFFFFFWGGGRGGGI